MPPTELRPLSLGELLDRAFQLYRGHFGLFVGISAVPQLGFVVILTLATILIGLVAGPGGAGAAGLLVLLVPVVVLGYVLATAFAQAATVFAVSEVYLGRPTGIRQSFSQVSGDVGAVVFAWIIIGLAMMAGLILLIVPGVIVLLVTALTVPALVIENLHARDAISRSMALTKGNWDRVFVIFVLVFVLTWVASFLFEIPFAALAQLLPAESGLHISLNILEQLGSLVAGVLVAPFGMIAFSVLYYDVRVRREAFDLQLLMQALGGPGSAGAPHTLPLGPE